MLAHEDPAVGSYRFAISRLIPQMTQVALQTHKKDLMRETSNFAKRTFLYRLSRSNYEKEWGKDYVKPGLGTRILSTLLRYMPRIGPFKGLSFNNPTPQTEDLYIKSINTTVDQYRAYLEAVRTDTLVRPNCGFDSGKVTKAAEYLLTTSPTQGCWRDCQAGSSTSPRRSCEPIFSTFIPTSPFPSIRKGTPMVGKACCPHWTN